MAHAHKTLIILSSFQLVHQGFLDAHVDLAISVEGFASLDMASHRCDDIGILDEAVGYAGEGSSGHVACGDFV